MITGKQVEITEADTSHKIPYPYMSMNRATNGGMEGLVLVTGQRGGGKSSILTTITAGTFIRETVFTLNLESTFSRTLNDTRLHMAERYDIKNHGVVGHSYDRFEKYRENIISCEIPEHLLSFEDRWDYIYEEMKYAHSVCKTRLFMLDNLSCIASTSTKLQSKVINDLTKFIRDRGGKVTVVLVAHLVKGSDTKILGSANIENLASSVWIHNRLDLMTKKKRQTFLEDHGIGEHELHEVSAVLTCTKIRDGGDINAKVLFKYDPIRKKNDETGRRKKKPRKPELSQTDTKTPKPRKKTPESRKRRKKSFLDGLLTTIKKW